MFTISGFGGSMGFQIYFKFRGRKKEHILLFTWKKNLIPVHLLFKDVLPTY